MRSLGTYLTHILVPIPEAQQQVGQHVHHVRLEELAQRGAEHLEGKEGSWGKKAGQLGRLPAASSPSGDT